MFAKIIVIFAIVTAYEGRANTKIGVNGFATGTWGTQYTKLHGYCYWGSSVSYGPIFNFDKLQEDIDDYTLGFGVRGGREFLLGVKAGGLMRDVWSFWGHQRLYGFAANGSLGYDFKGVVLLLDAYYKRLTSAYPKPVMSGVGPMLGLYFDL